MLPSSVQSEDSFLSTKDPLNPAIKTALTRTEAPMAEDKGKDQRSLEMRITELEDKLSKLHITEEEMKAYQKVSALVGSVQPNAGCIVDCSGGCINECAIRACTIARYCTIARNCTIARHCTIIRQCVECFECGPIGGGGGGGFGGGFGSLGG
jgi:hypothetical protein